MRVWIDQDLCVGNGICEELAPEIFYFDGNLAFVRDGEQLLGRGEAGMLTVPSTSEESVVDAAEECPAACIYVEA